MWSAMRNVTVAMVGLWVAGGVCAATPAPGAPISGRIESASAPSMASIAGATAPERREDAPDLRAEALEMGRESNAELEALHNMRRDIVKKQAEIEVLEADNKINELKVANGINNQQADLPELVGLYELPQRSWAEFVVGTAVLSVEPGEWVTPEWRLKAILGNGVELAGKSGGVRTVLFGRRSVPGSAPNDRMPGAAEMMRGQQ